MSAKLNEAQEHCKAAEKYLKTSIMRWKPDLDSAADEYNQAAQCYRIARDLNMSKDCYIKASELYGKNRSFFHAGKAIENALLVCKETATPDEIYAMSSDSSNFYQQYGSGDAGANVLDKGAKLIVEAAPELACKLYQLAADVSSAESSQHQGTEYISKASRILVKLARYDEAVDSIRREIGYNLDMNNCGAVGRLTVALVLVQLARGDAVAAEKAYKEWGNNCEVAEIHTIEQLIQGYDEEDRDMCKRALASPFIRSMDVEYARLAATMPLPEAMEVVPKANISQGNYENEASNVTPNKYQRAPSGDVEESEQGLSKTEDEDELC